MKKALLKDTVKQIFKTYKRFISILLMALLGVGFFAGIRAASPDMKKTVDKYFDEALFYDIQVVSTLGLTEGDVKALEKVEGIEKVYPSFSTDAFITVNNIETVVRIHEIEENINKLKIVEGYMPSTNSECVVEQRLIDSTDLKIGDYIEIKEDSDNEYLVTNRMKIVGTITSPIYISKERGTSSLGSGRISYYMYVPKQNINSDIYTEINISVKDVKNLDTLSEEYDEKVQYTIANIEKIKEERQKARYNELIDEANEELDEATEKLEKEKTEAKEKIEEAEKKLADGKKELKEGKEKLEKEKADAKQKIADAEEEIKKGYDEINAGTAKFNEEKRNAEKKFEEAEKQKEELQINLEMVIQGLEEVDSGIKRIDNELKKYSNVLSAEEIAKLNQTKAGLQIQKAELEKKHVQILSAISLIEKEISKGRNTLEKAENELKEGRRKLDDGTNEINKNKEKANNEFKKAEKEIKDAENEIKSGEEELSEKKQEFEEKIQDAEGKLIEARDELEKVKVAKWYILDRKDNTGYNSYSQDTDNVAKLGDVFPIVFFVIATLISLTTMTRMVEEERTQIGTFKALGYTNKQISMKYIIYAFFASVIGGTIGMIIGFKTLPLIIITMYQMMYIPMDLIIEFNIKYAIIGLGTMTFCILGATIYTVKKELKLTPSELMRPKAPKAGKRVFLEKIKFIWNNLSFTYKVTIRNMFRYKKRFLMTVIGIAGCTALIVAGYGLKDSITGMMEFQYSGVYSYDLMVTLKDTLTKEEIKELESKMKNKDEIQKTVGVYIEAANGINEGIKKELQIIVEKEKGSLNGIINLADRKTKEILELDDNTIFITDKLADLLKVKVGDEIVLEDSEKEEYKVKVGKIVENYIYHYVYMSESLYEKTYGKEENVNVEYVQYKEKYDTVKEEEISKELLNDAKTSTVILTSESRKSMDDAVSAMNIVVYILIVSAGILAFVVLYNLSNINISERIRELATIKVLGFYDKEVYDYITREIIFLTIIGIIFGLIFGYILTSFILGTCEIEVLRFKKVVKPVSYIYGILITTLFSIIVNIVTYFSLKKVDMIESLKSVE